MATKTFQAVYAAMTGQSSIGDFRTLEAHARHWREAAHEKLPKYIYPAGRRYRRVAGPTVKE